MSRIESLDDEPVVRCTAAVEDTDSFELLDSHATDLGGGFTIRRALPMRERRMIGPWCFLDHIGPAELGPEGEGLFVRPHPHIGLQTVTWLAEGGVLHRDSLGYREVIAPGALHVMTAGHGVSHSEESAPGRGSRIHGAQLWVALPESRRHGAATFERAETVPRLSLDGASADLFAGEFGGERVPVSWYWPMFGLDLRIAAEQCVRLPIPADHEVGVMVLEGELEAGGRYVTPGHLLYARPGQHELRLRAVQPTRVIVIGGAPFESPILMWWNFVARTRDEIAEARLQWESRDARFGQVEGWGDVRIPAPTQLPAASHG